MQLKYRGEERRVYPHLSLEVDPGDVVDMTAAPDWRFTPVTKPDPKKESAGALSVS